jgi:hypothetical protein
MRAVDIIAETDGAALSREEIRAFVAVRLTARGSTTSRPRS